MEKISLSLTANEINQLFNVMDSFVKANGLNPSVPVVGIYVNILGQLDQINQERTAAAQVATVTKG